MGLVGLLTNWDYGWIDLMDWFEKVILPMVVGLLVIGMILFIGSVIDIIIDLLGIYSLIIIILLAFVSFLVGRIVLSCS